MWIHARDANSLVTSALAATGSIVASETSPTTDAGGSSIVVTMTTVLPAALTPSGLDGSLSTNSITTDSGEPINTAQGILVDSSAAPSSGASLASVSFLGSASGTGGLAGASTASASGSAASTPSAAAANGTAAEPNAGAINTLGAAIFLPLLAFI